MNQRVVTYLGPPGTFSEQAARSQPDLAAQKLEPCRQIPDVIDAVQRGEAWCGVVPMENSIEGSVNVTVDTLAFESEMLIQREIVLPISLNLCVRQGTKLSDIKTVYAMPMAEAQCRGWMAKKLPDAEIVSSSSNAEAIDTVARAKEEGLAAIGNVLAAEMYGLGILAEEIEDHPDNRTRFVVVGPTIPPISGHDKTSIVCFQREDKPGNLLAMLSEFASRSLNLTKLESRPTKKSLGEYCFLIDFEGHIEEDLVADCLRDLQTKTASVKFLGSYPVAPTEDGHAKRKARGQRWKEAAQWIDGLRDKIHRELSDD